MSLVQKIMANGKKVWDAIVKWETIILEYMLCSRQEGQSRSDQLQQKWKEIQQAYRKQNSHHHPWGQRV
jgi:molybdenum-dependent DNA-binding transcriptional regulator ModE